MAITHSFTNENDLNDGGTWFDDFGRKICTWQWDSTSKAFEVTCGAIGRRDNLSEHGEQNFTDSVLRQRLPTLAIEIAEQINSTKYDI